MPTGEFAEHFRDRHGEENNVCDAGNLVCCYATVADGNLSYNSNKIMTAQNAASWLVVAE